MNKDMEVQTAAAPTREEMAKLVAEIDRLNAQLSGYSAQVEAKIDAIEAGMEELVRENERLIAIRESAEVERDACVALCAELALASGIPAGAAKGDVAVIDLPSGQVSWEIAPSEAHLLSKLPRYESAIEALEISEKYHRVMNSGVRSTGRA